MVPPIAASSKVTSSSNTLSVTNIVRRIFRQSSALAAAFILLFAFAGSRAFGQPFDSRSQSDSQIQNNKKQLPVSDRYMNLITHWYDPWPQETFNSIRLWDTGTTWSDINTAPGVYDWTAVDGWMNAATQHQVGVLFTLGMTPQWASSDPGNTSCNNGPGACAPPDDLNPDGTGTDQHWKDFVTAIMQHVGTQVGYFEIWNEPNNPNYFSGCVYHHSRRQSGRSRAQCGHGGAEESVWDGLVERIRGGRRIEICRCHRLPRLCRSLPNPMRNVSAT
jgi:hypothetical protein